MKNRLSPFALTFLTGLALVNGLAAKNIGYVEKFSLAEDREEALALLVPGSRDYYYYHALHAQNKGDFQEVGRIIGLWIKRYGHTGRVKEVLNRQALLNYDEKPDETINYLKRELGLGFNHSRVIEGQKPKHPTTLNADLVSFDAFLQRAFRQYGNLQGVTDRGLLNLNGVQLNETRLRHFLSRLQRPDVPGLPALVVKDLKAKHSRGFGSHGIHRNMTKAQLDELLQLKPDLIDNANFINVYLLKLAPSDDADVTFDLEEKKKHLNRLYVFVKGLAPAHNSLKANVIYRILAFQRSQGEWNRQLFLEYLSLPHRAQYVTRQRLESAVGRDHRIAVNPNADYRSYAKIERIGSDSELVRSFFLHYFAKDKDFDGFVKLVRDDYLKPLFAEAKLLAGVGDPEKWYSMLSSGAVEALKNRVDLDFPPYNKRFFKANEAVKLKLSVKNVETLLVKVFEINTFNFYSRNLQPVDTAINLDGLAATWERVLNYKDAPMKRTEREFAFPELNKRGVFVVEFIGNGKSSRALVHKGNLRFIEKLGPAGHEFKVLDGNNKIRPKATVWLDGTEYSPDKDGILTIPFSNRPGRRPIILRDQGFCSLGVLDHVGENYQIDAAIHLDRESLVKGQTAKAVIRPLLRLNGYPVSSSLLEDAKLVVRSVDHDGSPSMTEVELPALNEGEDFIHEFLVPEKLSQLLLSFSAKVQNISRATKDNLSSSRSFTVNQMDRSLKFESVHLGQSGAAYFLDALGRNGEAILDRALVLQVKHLDFAQTYNVNLKTDQNGRIMLGKLDRIDWIRAIHSDGSNYHWSIDRDRKGRNAQPSVIHASAGEVIEVALPGVRDDAAKPSVYSLLSKHGSFYDADHSAAGALRAGYLHIEGLAPGDYELFLKQTRQSISIRVTAGKRNSGFILSDNRVLEDNRLDPVQIRSVNVADGKATIRLGNVSKMTRLHVYATRFVPHWDGFAALDVGGVPSPYTMRLSKKRSLYVEEREIGEEYRYVLDRRYAAKYAGNMLARPGLILNPWSVRKTDTARQNAAQGGEYDRASDDMFDSKRAGKGRGSSGGAMVDYANLDFLGSNSLLWSNLKPDDKGVAVIDLKDLSSHQRLHVYALDPWNVAYRPVALPATKLERKELRMARTLDSKKPFSEQKLISTLAKGDEFKLADVTTSKVQLYDNLASVHGLLSTLTSNSNLAEFAFLLEWPGLKAEEKRAKYSKYACHELNFFIFKKDPDFFKKVIRPYLANKKDKTFMDHWLLGADLESYLEPYAFSKLNAVERILLARKGPAGTEAMARYVRELQEMIPPDPEEFNRLFDTAIVSAALDTDDQLGLREQQANQSRRDLLKMADTRNGGERASIGFLAGGGSGGRALRLNAPKKDASPQDGRIELEANAELSLNIPEPAADFALASTEKSLRKAKEEKKKSQAWFKSDKELSGYLLARERKRVETRQFYRKLPPTEEWAENNYYKLPIERQNADLVLINAFWNDYAAHLEGKPFVSGNFIYATRNFTEMMLALAVLDLPFEAAEHEVDNEERSFSLKSDKPLVVFHEEIRETEDDKKARDILLSQNFFRADSRFRHEGSERFDNFVKDEFLKQIAYGCQIVITNPTSSVRKLRYLAQIPVGAMPLNNGFYSDGRPFRLEPYSTKTVDFYFYFPATGEYPVYPIQVANDKGRVAGAGAFSFKVVDKLSKRDVTSWAWISQNGTEKEVLQYLANHNMNRIDLDQIAYRMRNKGEGGGGKAFFDKALKLLSDRFAFHPTLWSYALYHKDEVRMKEFLSRSSMANRCGLYLRSPLLAVDPVERGFHQHLEYKPLVNARAHQLGKDRQILNNRLYGQYHQLMHVLKYVPSLSDEDLLAATYYLFLQDRVGEGLLAFSRIRPQQVVEKMQLDYLSTYVDFYKGEVASARQRATKYKDYPVDRWKNLFREAIAQLDEAAGKLVDPVDEEDRGQAQNALASTEPSLELEVEKGEVSLHVANLETCTVNYYPMDVELLFSRKPFVKDDTDHFTSIVPNLSREVKLPKNKDKHSFALPDEFQDRNVMVEVLGAGLRVAKAYYANDLRVQLIENYGQVRVAHSETGKPLPKTYVKVYAKLNDGRTRFYKDGYTDLRGRFDYASLNTGDLDEANKFSILVLHDRHGALIRESKPPKQ